MNHEELFVGAVSVVLGLGGLIAAIGNKDFCYRLDKVRWLESMAGRLCARVVYALLGVMLISLGIAIALGFGPNKSANRGQEPGNRKQEARSRKPEFNGDFSLSSG